MQVLENCAWLFYQCKTQPFYVQQYPAQEINMKEWWDVLTEHRNQEIKSL